MRMPWAPPVVTVSLCDSGKIDTFTFKTKGPCSYFGVTKFGELEVR